ncbi:MAG: Clp1/GlmU family protein [Desulfurococcaceae archaeon]
MVTLKLAEGEGVKLYGPMSITVLSGKLGLYGKVVSSGERFVVHKARNYVVEALSTCELEVTMIDESQIQPLEPEDPYWEKKKVVEEIADRGYQKIVVLGCVDCGKTALVTMIYNVLKGRGHKVAVIDGDVGQADIGPPGFITAGTSEGAVCWISELKPIAMRFIGDIKPQHFMHTIAKELSRLAEKALVLGYSKVVIDTDGWVGDESAIAYKHRIVEELKPDAIVAIGEDLQKLFSKYSKLGVAVYTVKPPVHRKTRSREERRMLRSFKYREYLENAPLVRVRLDEVIVYGLPILQGIPVEGSSIANLIEGKVLYASRMPGALYVYGFVKSFNAEELKKLGFEKIKTYQAGFEKSLYCAVGAYGESEYPCIIEKLDFEKGEVVLRTKYTGKIDVIKVSKIRLTQDYLEEYIEV